MDYSHTSTPSKHEEEDDESEDDLTMFDSSSSDEEEDGENVVAQVFKCLVYLLLVS
jgi:hypothetical protein